MASEADGGSNGLLLMRGAELDYQIVFIMADHAWQIRLAKSGKIMKYSHEMEGDVTHTNVVCNSTLERSFLIVQFSLINGAVIGQYSGPR